MTQNQTEQASFTLRGRNPDVLTCIANLSNDEVFTPPEFANRMLDTLAAAWAEDHKGADLWANKEVKFLDPFTKSGVFLREITSRLTVGLASEIPNLQKRVDHILTKQVFGIGITQLTSLLARRSVYTYRHDENITEDNIFKIRDTLTSRAEIVDLSAKFKDEVVAVIGLGGTGAFLLDFLVKTPVKEIRGFDLDDYHVHNAFRSPGMFDVSEFQQKKADVYQARYENFRHGLVLQKKFIDASCAEDFEGVTFAFVCVDKGPSRAAIFDILIAKKIPFIDVGMGLKRKNGLLTGMARTTYYSAKDAQQVKDMGLAELSERPDDLYHTNIQIAELNALNAALAVIKFKQLKGFYREDAPVYQMLFGVTDLKIGTEASLDEIESDDDPACRTDAEAA